MFFWHVFKKIGILHSHHLYFKKKIEGMRSPLEEGTLYLEAGERFTKARTSSPHLHSGLLENEDWVF